MDGQAVEGRGAKRPRLSRTVKAFAAGAVCLMVGLLWWQKRADDFGGIVLAVEDALGMNKEPEPVSGAVTVNGRPLARGRINFTPLEPANQPTGFYTQTHVQDGNYAYPRGAGPPPGVYAVMIERWTPAFGLAYDEASRGRPAMLLDMLKNNHVKTRAAVKAGVKNDFDLKVPGW